jgi:hypothetical protein
MTRPDEIAALADRLTDAFKNCARESFYKFPIQLSVPEVELIASALRLSATPPGDAVRDWPAIEHSQRPETAVEERLALKRQISNLGAVVILSTLQTYALAAPSQGSYAGSLWAIMEYLSAALAPAEKAGGEVSALSGARYGTDFSFPRKTHTDTGVPTRSHLQHFSPAELAIFEATTAVEAVGGSVALTDAVNLLQQARDRVADHMEGVVDPSSATPTPPSGDVYTALQGMVRLFDEQGNMTADFKTMQDAINYAYAALFGVRT